MSSANDRSNGFLPLRPLRHAEPTAVGVWDMDGGNGVQPPVELPAHGFRDQVVLARLHGQPLAIMDVDETPESTTRSSLLEAVWRAANDAIIEHLTTCGCMPVPEDLGELSMLLDADRGSCPNSAPSRPPGRAAVIVCTAGAHDDALARCLSSLAGMESENFEVIVVDNRPSLPGTRALVESFTAARIRYVAEPRSGLARARNAGVAAAADAEFLAFTDDDVVVDGGWLSWLLAPFSRPGVMAATGLVMPLSLSSLTEKRFEHYAGFGKGVGEAAYDLAEHSARERFLYPYWGGMFGSGNSMAFRRDALSSIGGFDPALGAGTPTAGGEDLAAFSDVILRGGRLVYQPRALCWHEHRGDEQALRDQIRNYGVGLTAVLWRYLTRDPRFSMRVIGSLAAMARLARSRSGERQLDVMPADLARLELQGRLLGPWRYLVSSLRSHSAVSADAAHQIAGERRQDALRAGAPGQIGGERRPGVDQAGAQTRT